MTWRQKTLGTMTAFVRGDPPWLVLVHGFAGAPWDWCRVLTLLGPQIPVALVELPGHGPQNRTLPSNWEHASHDLARWLEMSQLAAGYSMGGRLLASALSGTQKSMTGLLMGAHTGLRGDEKAARKEWDQTQARQLETESLEEFRRRWSLMPILRRVSPDSAAEQERLSSGRAKLRVKGLAWAMKELGSGSMPAIGDTLRLRRHAITWAAGEMDHKYCEIAEMQATRESEWSFRSISNSGHCCHLDNPQEVYELIMENL